jgi:hypothetical protein
MGLAASVRMYIYTPANWEWGTGRCSTGLQALMDGGWWGVGVGVGVATCDI